MSNHIKLFQEIKNNHLFSKWKMRDYKVYMHTLITITKNKGSDYVYNRYTHCKLPFVVFRTIDDFYYIDPTQKDIVVNKFDKRLNKIESYNLGYRSLLQIVLENINNNV